MCVKWELNKALNSQYGDDVIVAYFYLFLVGRNENR